jgi:hypothetical protein
MVKQLEVLIFVTYPLMWEWIATVHAYVDLLYKFIVYYSEFISYGFLAQNTIHSHFVEF